MSCASHLILSASSPAPLLRKPALLVIAKVLVRGGRIQTAKTLEKQLLPPIHPCLRGNMTFGLVGLHGSEQASTPCVVSSAVPLVISLHYGCFKPSILNLGWGPS